MPREDASNLRSGDFRMRLRAAVNPRRSDRPGRLPSFLPVSGKNETICRTRASDRERPETKHQSTGRKRKQQRYPK